MSITRNSKGKFFRHGIGGTYPINDGDPQNDDPDFDEEEANRIFDDAELEHQQYMQELREERDADRY